MESRGASGLPLGLCGFGDGDGPDRTRARSAGNRGTDARGLLAHGPSAPDAKLRPPGDPADRTKSGDRDWTVHSHRRGRTQSNWLVHNHLGAHSRGLANGARSFLVKSATGLEAELMRAAPRPTPAR